MSSYKEPLGNPSNYLLFKEISMLKIKDLDSLRDSTVLSAVREISSLVSVLRVIEMP